ncbi:MAG TPA: L-histidine N(alpha)-methyltransferase [Burkholderiaceae bacterium]|nr:L-histidine N(alpha)-methyltransferase [Burkholderiaceae bacterium]
MGKSVFISHLTDEGVLAQALKAALRSDFLNLLSVFVSSDLQSITVGKPWLDQVRSALADADLLLVLCSQRSVSRPWINFEAGAAWLQEVPIVPVCHSGLELNQLPMPLSALQGVSLVDPLGLRRIYEAVAQLLEVSVPARSFDELASTLSALQVMPLPLKDVLPAESETDPKVFLNDSTLTRAIDHASLGWTLCFVGEDQIGKVAQLTRDLDEGRSEDGNGKRFASGFSYWGIGPTLAWARACTDPMYLVAKAGIESFPGHWKTCAARLPARAHYVSLGVGTGQKDRTILRDLLDRDPRTYFFPVDMSGEMLRFGIAECRKNEDLKRSQILPIQIDFSTRENAASIWGVVTSVAGDQPVVYSLLGNTLANFDDDQGLLEVICGLLRSQDRLLLEVATTDAISPAAAARAAAEYKRSESFYSFVTSALDYYTSLQIERDSVAFLPTEGDGALEVRVVYRNQTGSPIPIKVTTGTQIRFEPNETIRLLLTRKYLEARIMAMVAAVQCEVEALSKSQWNRDGFGSILLLLAPKTAPAAR